MTGKKIDIFWAFLVGAILSVLTEALWWLLLAIGLPADSWAIIVMLMILAFIGMVASYFGWFQRLVGLAGFGAFLPFCSLPCSIMMETSKALAQGDSLGKAAYKGLKEPFFVFGTGISFSIVITLIVYWVQGADACIAAMAAAGAVEAAPMSLGLFVRAFLVGGVICAVWQIFFRVNHLPVAVNMAIGVYTGAVLTALGAVEHIVGFAGRGMTLMILETGEAIYRWFSAILLFHNWSGLLRFCLLLAFTFLGSTLVFGRALYLREKKQKSAVRK